MIPSTDDDCFCASPSLMTVEEALALLERTLSVAVGVETLSLTAASGRVLARDVVSSLNLPPHDNSAMDGYGVFLDDLHPDTQTRLPVTGRVPAGGVLGRKARRGEAIRIFTGAAIPEGIDTVLMQEDCQDLGDGQVLLPSWKKRGANCRRAGEDVAAGAVAVLAGSRLRAQEIGLIAAVGQSEISVYRPLRVALFSTGDELREPGHPLTPGCIHDANRYSVRVLLEGLGCAVTDLGILPDRLPVVSQALKDATPGHDLILTSGGVSTGEEDHVKNAVESLGTLHFWRLAIKPGKPLAMGHVAGVPFVGLPGNPVAAMVTFLILGRAVVARLSGRTPVRLRPYSMRAGFSTTRAAGRREFLRARVLPGEDGLPTAVPFPTQSSAVLSSLVHSEVLIDLGECLTSVKEGDMVPVLSLAELAW
ncbi:MAG: gephyrin-like molybdotransferase Glp [Alphaproteobacteria bacterium]